MPCKQHRRNTKSMTTEPWDGMGGHVHHMDKRSAAVQLNIGLCHRLTCCVDGLG